MSLPESGEATATAATGASADAAHLDSLATAAAAAAAAGAHTVADADADSPVDSPVDIAAKSSDSSSALMSVCVAASRAMSSLPVHEPKASQKGFSAHGDAANGCGSQKGCSAHGGAANGCGVGGSADASGANGARHSDGRGMPARGAVAGSLSKPSGFSSNTGPYGGGAGAETVRVRADNSLLRGAERTEITIVRHRHVRDTKVVPCRRGKIPHVHGV